MLDFSPTNWLVYYIIFSHVDAVWISTWTLWKSCEWLTIYPISQSLWPSENWDIIHPISLPWLTRDPFIWLSFRSFSEPTEQTSNIINTMSDMGRRTASVFRSLMSSNLRKSDINSKGVTINLRECLPATYCNAKGIAKAIKVSLNLLLLFFL